MRGLRLARQLSLVVDRSASAQRGAKPAPAKPAGPQFFTTPLTVDQMRSKQAVVETDLGTIVIDLCRRLRRITSVTSSRTREEGTYVGTTFPSRRAAGDRAGRRSADEGSFEGRRVRYRRSRRASGREERRKKYARARCRRLWAAEIPDSGGTQFFICVADQPGLDGMYDVFGRVSEGILVAQKISEIAADEKGRPNERIAIRSVTIRDKPAAGPEAFSTETAAELSAYRAVLETSMGDITHRVRAGQSAGARAQLSCASRRRASTTGMGVHRVAKGFVIQTRISAVEKRAAVRVAAASRAQSAAGVQRHAAREGHCLDGSRRQSRERRHVVLHRPRSEPCARREIHRVRPRR